MAATSQGWNWQLTSAPLKYYFYLILFGLKAIRISVYSRDMSPPSVFTRHLTNWQFMARSQISSSFQISRWPLSLHFSPVLTRICCWDNFIIVTLLPLCGDYSLRPSRDCSASRAQGICNTDPLHFTLHIL